MEIYDNAFREFSSQYKDDITALYAYAQMWYDKGEFLNAANYFIECINKDWTENKKRRIDVINKAARAAFASGNFKGNYVLLKLALEQSPEQPQLMTNIATAAYKIGEYEESIAYYLKVHELDKTFILPVDGLASAYAKSGDAENSKKYSLMSLGLKDKEAAEKERLDWLKTHLNIDKILVDKEIIPFNCETPERNIIAFSLWGSDHQYLDSALTNSVIAPVIYPGWRARFYCDDSVPPEIIKQLKANQAEVIHIQSKGAYYGLFWRFLVASDPGIDRFLVRDCDSLLNCQERVAVDEWLASDKHFHLMRDYCTHSELILAGLWGGVGGVIPEISFLINAYYDKSDKVCVIDQHFLRYCIWPFVKQSHLAHDEYFAFGNAKPFPELGKFPSKEWHVGMNWAAYLQQQKS